MAKLNIEIGAKANSANSVIDNLKSKLGAMGSFIGKIGIATAAMFGVTKSKDTLMEWIDGLSQLGHEASRIGLTTDELQRLKSAATKMKIDPDAMVTGIEKMATIVDDAAQGSEEAIFKFKRMGITMNELAGKSVYEQFARISDGIQSMNTATEKTSMARDIFGKLGGKLVELTANFRQLGDEFDKSGRMINAETVENAERFDLAMKSLGGTFKAAFLQSGVVEYLAEVAEGFKTIQNLARKLDQNQVKGRYSNKMTNTAEFINDLFGLGFLNQANGEVLRLDAPSQDQFMASRNKQLMTKGDKAEAAKSAEIAKQDYANRDYNKVIGELQKQLDAQIAITSGKKDTAEAQKLINDLETKGNKLTRQQKDAINQLATDKQNLIDRAKAVEDEKNAAKSIQDSIAALEEKRKEQELITAGRRKEAEIEAELSRARKEAKRELTAEELARIAAAKSAEYDARELNTFKGAQGAVITDQFSKIGGAGGKLFGQDNTPKLQLAAVAQSNRYLAEIQSGVKKLTSTSTTLRAP